MAGGITVTITRNLLDGMSGRAHRWAAGLTSDTAGEIQARARQHLRANGSIRTGALYNGVQVTSQGDTAYTVMSTREVGGDDPDVPRYVEFGTVHASARPYFTPAVEETRPRFNADTRAIERALVG